MKINGGRCRIRALGGSRRARWWRRMAQKKYLQAKLTQFLREDRIQLWKPPYTDENKEGGLALKDLAKKYSDRLECCENEVEKIIEEIRCKAIERGTGNENYKTTGIATIEVFLPPRLRKDRKNLLETRLHITGRELRSKIAETFGFQENYIKIVINKKQLQLGKTLEEQGVTHNVKAMVLELKQSEEDVRKRFQVAEEEQNEAELKEKRIQRTRRGLEILAERAEMVVDPETTPYLDIANQTGRSIRIPPSERKELAQIRKEEKEKKRRRLENINSLKGMGYSAHAAKQALHQASGNLDEALKILLSNPQMWWLNDSDPETNNHQEGPSQENIDQLVYMGFDAVAAGAALRVFRGNVQLAAQTLAHNGGSLPPDLQLAAEDASSTPSTSPSDSAGTSSASTDEDMETEAVNEILEDIPEHEEDYLDSTLEDEEIIIAEYLSYVENIKSATKKN
ncbi:NEDD8 ultimate buster 1 isoform X3 [Callorhinus ursinus]|uniref:NEDD8 ultimate buster 1 n=1 Tax=Zalophus californianus TaxID=9704 RepID=A0A6P9FBH3_ZALCA|nr:NEDD8 ultimate buster 1 isoform X2 [Zalophus californianus]